MSVFDLVGYVLMVVVAFLSIFVGYVVFLRLF